MPDLYFEEVTERRGDIVLASNLRKATQQDINEAARLHKLGKCPHTIIVDEHTWLYDFRSCATCGKPLGTV